MLDALFLDVGHRETKLTHSTLRRPPMACLVGCRVCGGWLGKVRVAVRLCAAAVTTTAGAASTSTSTSSGSASRLTVTRFLVFTALDGAASGAPSTGAVGSSRPWGVGSAPALCHARTSGDVRAVPAYACVQAVRSPSSGTASKTRPTCT
eukprot:scaffold1734_cov113-Isochrysis_galbana.AAC.8